MTEIEQKALALLNEVAKERGNIDYYILNRDWAELEALCRVIEQHEAFKQEVSDAVEMDWHSIDYLTRENFRRFIIPKSEPDPLVRVINEVIYAQPQGPINEATMAKDIRAALEARGLEIREKGA